MSAYTGEITYSLSEGVFADAVDVEDAEFKMLEAFKEDMPEAFNVVLNNIVEVNPKRGK